MPGFIIFSLVYLFFMVAAIAVVTFVPSFILLKSIFARDEISTAESPSILFIVIFGSACLIFCSTTGIGIIKKWKWAKLCFTIILGLNIFSLVSSIISMGMLPNPKLNIFILIILLVLSGIALYGMEFDRSVKNYFN